MASERIYLMSVAASGKSTFAREHEFYSGYRIVDYASRLPEQPLWARLILYLTRPFPALRRELRKMRNLRALDHDSYFAGVLELMHGHAGPLAVLGRRLPDDFRRDDAFHGVEIGLVLIPEEQHRRNCLARRGEMRNPLPFMHHWTTEFDKIQRMRKRAKHFAEHHGIPVFDSFRTAIDELAERSASAPARKSPRSPESAGGSAG